MNSAPIKICHIASVDITVKFLLLPQLRFLKNEGYQVHVVCSDGPMVEEIRKEGFLVEIIPLKRKVSLVSDVIAFFRLIQYFRKEKFTIVHTHAPKPGLLGQVAARLARIPVRIHTVHGLYVTEHSSLSRNMLFTFLERLTARCCTLILSQNREDMYTMQKKRMAGERKLRYLGNGIDLSRFSLEKHSHFAKALRDEVGIPSEKKVIGTVGRLVKEKGYLDLFEALKIVLKKRPDVLLVSIGPKEPDKRDRFNPAIIKEYGLENSTLFLGERKDVEKIYPIMDMFVLASHREGFPRSVIEAMAMERPIIVTDIRGCREEVDDKIHGLRVPLKNPEKLAEAMLYLLDNPEEAKRMAEAAKHRAWKEFDERLVFERISAEYKAAICAL